MFMSIGKLKRTSEQLKNNRSFEINLIWNLLTVIVLTMSGIQLPYRKVASCGYLDLMCPIVIKKDKAKIKAISHDWSSDAA